MPKTKTRQLNALLMKAGFTDPDACLTNSASLTPYGLPSTLPFGGRLYIHTPQGKPPKWLDFIANSLPAGTISPFFNVNNGAILFVNAGSRLLAFTFGYVRQFIRLDAFERDFGIKVALNTVDPEKLRSIDSDLYEDLTIHMRRQTSRGSGIGSFGLDISQVMRGVTGQPRDPQFAKRLTGSDALAFATPIEFKDLATKCLTLVAAYEDDIYKDTFPWFDDLRTVRSPALLEELDALLIERLQESKTESVYLAPPDVVDWQQIDQFSYSTKASDRVDDLSIESYVETVEDTSKLTLEDLKKNRAYSHWADTDAVKDTWSIYDCVVFEVEVEVDGAFYVLTGGRWFNVADSLVQSVNATAKRLAENPLALPAFEKKHKDEKGYNKAVSDTHPEQYGLGDRKTVSYGGGYSKVEVCDLFSNARQFIHVKRKTRSSTLSHLFGQGAVSSQAFLQAQAFRQKFRDIFEEGSAYRDLIPESKPDASMYEVAFAIVAPESANWPLSLPFFSKLHLQQTASRLELWNYKVSLTRISES